MKEIVCTNCKESFEVSEEHYQSKKMIFNCNHCRVEIRRNEESGEWEATESLPVSEKEKEFQAENHIQVQKPRTLLEMVRLWRDRVVMIGWFAAAYYVVLIGFVSSIDKLSVVAISLGIAKSLFVAYFIAFLLECLAKHLENQEEMIKLLKKYP